MKRLVMLMVSAAMLFTVSPALAQIAGTQHDYQGTTTHGRCEVCHVPHAAKGTKRLWRVAVTFADYTSWGSSVVGTLCGRCHNGGGQAGANANTVPPQNVGGTVYGYACDPHGRDWDVLQNTLGGAASAVAGKPYTGLNGGIDVGAGRTNLIECTSCHNVHYDGDITADKTARPFIRKGADVAHSGQEMSEFCEDCHADRASYDETTNNHPVKIYEDSTAGNRYIQNPPNSALTHAVGFGGSTTSWSLGSKFEIGSDGTVANPTVGTDEMSCISCHAVHNPAATPKSPQNMGLHLLAIDNTGMNAGLCQGCHGGPTVFGSQTTAGVIGVGGAYPADSDHPINTIIGSTNETIDLWFNNATTTITQRNERYDSTADTYWPRGSSTSGTYDKIICTSCHSAHRARTNQLQRRLIGAGTTAGEFCTSCHSQVSPLGHHSHYANSTSSLTCGSCHGGSGGAHNGFGKFQFLDTQNQYSNLCATCHLDSSSPWSGTTWQGDSDTAAIGSGNPVQGIYAGWAASFHLPGGGSVSHYLGTFTNISSAGILVKRSAWAFGKSKFGSIRTVAVPNVDTGWGDPASPDDTGNTMICESCHSVLWNMGADKTNGATASSGYLNNLLLQDYQDDSTDTAVTTTAGSVGSGLCVGCHNRTNVGSAAGVVSDATVQTDTIVPAGMHPMTGWSITRAQDAGRTPTTLINTPISGAGSSYATVWDGSGGGARTAGAASVSYPATDAMDCDSCHRPHSADNNAHYTTNPLPDGTNRTNAPVILEKAGPVDGRYDDLCVECHAY